MNRASGVDCVPPEYWIAISSPDTPAAKWALTFCQQCWEQKAIPDKWHDASVAMIFKKGDPADRANYRPISLLCIGYKLFAGILLRRLQDGGAEQELWPTQFGFRRERGTTDALFLARRVIEQRMETQKGRAVLLALDWAKAFDSISPDGMAAALLRFGVPGPLVQMIAAIYTDRRFYVNEGSQKSTWRRQCSRISQGCPLSPFLFIIVMTILLRDAKAALAQNCSYTEPQDFVSELVYADDTLVMAMDEDSAHAYMTAIATEGHRYGLSFNWSKLEVLAVNCRGAVAKPDGSKLDVKPSIKYLGSTLAADGRTDSELGRRIGAAKQDFQVLRRVWSHAALSLQQKLAIFRACILSKLSYGLEAVCLNQVSRRRLDGFHCRCLRSMLRIPAAYYSRITNADVFCRAGQQPLSQHILRQQMAYMGKLARRPDADPVRRTIFEAGSIDLRPLPGKRRVGRPRTSWAPTVMEACLEAAGSTERLQHFFARTNGNAQAWRLHLNAVV